MRLAASLIVTLLVAVSLSAQYARRGLWIDATDTDVLSSFGTFPNDGGTGGILHADGSLGTATHPFFTPLGTNGRACVTCHQPAWGMSVSAEALRDRWIAAGTNDPVFAAVDGSNCPGLPQHLQASHSLAIERGLFRIPLAPPDDAEFTIEIVRDPTSCNISPRYGLGSTNPAVSVFRRPRPVANLRFVTEGADNLMADGREPSLRSQARSAVLGHQQGSAVTEQALDRIEKYEMQVYAAQVAEGLGPELLSRGVKPNYSGLSQEARRGADIFMRRQFSLAGVAHSPTVNIGAKGTCASCHSTPMTGQAPSAGWADVGTTNREISGLPLFKITCGRTANPHPEHGREIYTTDPGRALVSGKCADVGSIVMQQLRGLAARPPYFVNGSARTLRDVVDFYDARFGMHLTTPEKVDLVRFLEAL